MDEKYAKMTQENCARLCEQAPMWRTNSPLVEKQLATQKLYEGRIIDLRLDDVELPGGAHSKREYVEHPGGAGVLPVDEDGFVYLVAQYRYPYREVTIEIPAGKLEKGEDAAIAAARELEEETGLRAKTITPYGVLYPTPGYTNEKLYIFLAQGLQYVGEHPDSDEFLNVLRMPLRDALDKVLCGDINDSKTCYAILKYELLDEKKRS